MAIYGYLCMTPKDECCGSVCDAPKGMGILRRHASSQEALRCYSRYLIRMGYERVSKRLFRPPNGGPLLLLTKESRFGTPLRTGKRGDKVKKATRGISWRKDAVGGLIRST